MTLYTNQKKDDQKMFPVYETASNILLVEL